MACCAPPGNGVLSSSFNVCRPCKAPAGAAALVIGEEFTWDKDATLKVYFMCEDSDPRPAHVLSIAAEWTPHTSVTFVRWMDPEESDIRVSFGYYYDPKYYGWVKPPGKWDTTWDWPELLAILGHCVEGYYEENMAREGPGYKPVLPTRCDGGAWSFIGTAARNRKKFEPTMNLGHPVFTCDGSRRDPSDLVGFAARCFRGTVLHEFGHALGFHHENPGAVPYDRKAVYKKYMGPPNNWTKEEVDFNLFEVAGVRMGGEFDRDSIMSYKVDESLLDKGDPKWRDFVNGFNSELSDRDKAYAKRAYRLG